MLSYRHSFHAGNFADVLKHLIQVEVLEYLQRKDKPFVYIDTHAAAGVYLLESVEAIKNEEYRTGIGRLAAADWPELGAYLDAVGQCQQAAEEPVYPGSPWFGQHYLRPQDRAFLYELHPQDLAILEQMMQRDRRVQVRGEDGFAGLIALLPTHIKRGLVLMDPPYEIKTDYHTVVETLVAAYRRMATATYALWYPVVERHRIDQLERAFQSSRIRNIQLFELGIAADTEERGMTASGMILINPPYTLKARMEALLPRLAHTLGGETGNWRAEVLVAE
ncbi:MULTISPECIES: 23S rRNA (adenine(2030)-N(6))-methyltransferase RlmJ [unclassified Oceanobacter]|uniref:23S rRNA (adenine(2030)-N(6))-methyltransferase RlmJ n=2 Tax=Gammaproteobacteria TaxID=1236 RepID=UPI0026E25ED4|nr:MULTISPECIES: 23S rRNA (adenine(2030)-N(6))-methyltransferase RlmJ [unclassified Oceanobacter]MDO6683544.1 23S rRNA (adenine(2030)-N(6))-methyltransferase RlmJ [Oceanobacter sp. 5_MG-2023]MDP2607524.1 23S rRNA (adenine(2030)-N(6))-methyltransferase RlmJ [Oceanobacter sp. 1_MG-2023]MDP2610792.1 23S rRNA (adenine(2030)-N(6))-methyltransferase RlmJ [Oceanobacter sp. 2_MG-2023]